MRLETKLKALESSKKRKGTWVPSKRTRTGVSAALSRAAHNFGF